MEATLFGVGTVALPLGLLALYRLTHRRRLWPIYAVLVGLQFAQYALASLVTVDLAGLSWSPGSVLLYPANLTLILLIYVKRSGYEFRRVCAALLVTNVALCAAACLARERHWLVGTELAPLVNSAGVRMILGGAILLVVECLLMMFLYDVTSRAPLSW